MKKNEIEKLKPCTLQDVHKVMLDMLVKIDKICKKHNIDYWLCDGTLLGAVRHGGFIPWDDDLDISMMYEDYQRFIKIAQVELGDEYFVQNYKTDKEYKGVVVLTKIRDNNSIYVEEYNAKYHEGIYIDVFVMDRYFENDKKFLLKKKLYRAIFSSKMNFHKYENLSTRIAKIIFKILFFVVPAKQIIKLGEKADKKHLQKGDMVTYGFSTPTSTRYEYKYDDIFPLKKRKFEGIEFSVPNNEDGILRVAFGDYMQIPNKENQRTHSLFYCLLNKQD